MTQQLHSWVYIKKKSQNTNSKKDTCTPMFIEVLFITAKTWKQPKRLLGRMDKENVVYTHNGILLSHKKKNAIFNNMYGPRDCLYLIKQVR